MIPDYNTYFNTINAKTPSLKAKGVQASSFTPVQLSRDSGRTAIIFTAVASAQGLTTVETACTMTIASGTGATTSAATYNIPAGKTLRLTNIYFGVVGNATGALSTTLFNLRINTAGAVTTSSTPIIATARLLTTTANLNFVNLLVPMSEGLEITGSATMNIGLTLNCTYAAGVPTSDFMAIGYLY